MFARRLFLLVFLIVTAKALVAETMAAETLDLTGLEETEATLGQTIRLLAVHPSGVPEGLEGFTVWAPTEAPANRYGDLLGHVVMPDGSWLQETLVMEGKARVMPVYERDPTRLAYLRDIEDTAREARVGLWGKRPIVCADLADQAFDSFSLVQGLVLDAANVRGTIYLNFGADWRNDFTIKIERAAFNTLPEAVQEALKRLTELEKPDIVVEARGWVFYSGGPMINVKTAAQLDILAPGSDKIIEGCAS